jgi:hypothetical protein
VANKVVVKMGSGSLHGRFVFVLLKILTGFENLSGLGVNYN